MTTKKDLLAQFLLPSTILFMFLFNVTWSTPISILSREFSISSYHIFNNVFVIISFFISVIYGISLYVTKYMKIQKWLFVIPLTVVLMATMYPFLFPYKYGFFQDVSTLTPEKSLLGFSKLYYLLDVALLIIALYLAILTFKYKIQLIPMILLFFYSYTNIITIINLDIKKTLNGAPNKTITFSKNHTNIIVYIPDSVGPPALLHSITNNMLLNADWTNDYIFYDNVVTPSTGGTTVSLPSLIGGEEFTPTKQITFLQKHTQEEINKLITEMKIPPFKHDRNYLFADLALKRIKEELPPNFDVSYAYINNRKVVTEDQTDLITVNQYLRSPILAVSIYDRLPYILRPMLSKVNGIGWRNKTFFEYRWALFDNNKNYTIRVKDTDKNTLNYIHSWGLHVPYKPQIVDNTTTEGQISNMYSALNFSYQVVTEITKLLKENNAYDTSKIILTTDHGGPLVTCYQKLTSKSAHNFYTNYFRYGAVDSIPMYFMIKDFKTPITNFTIDGRILSGADLKGIIISSVTNSDKYVDYTKVTPPKRIFNTLLIKWPSIAYLINPKDASKYIKETSTKVLKDYGKNGDQFGYLKFTTMKEFKNTNIYYQAISNIESLPATEILK